MAEQSKGDEPLVTVFCLTYNHKDYIRQCLDGFLMQKTDFPFEILVHDDASTDGTADIVREYESRHPDLFRVIYESANVYSKRDGTLYPLVTERVRGEYIAYCEGDDYWTHPQKLQMQVDYMRRHPKCGLVYTDLDYYYQDKGITHKNFVTTARYVRPHRFLDHLLYRTSVQPCTWLIRSRFFREMPAKFFIDFTFPVVLDVFAQMKVGYIGVNTTVYRVLGESLSHSESPERRYNILRGLLQIQLDYMRKYPKLVSDLAKKRILHETYTKSEICDLAAFVGDEEFLRAVYAFYENRPIDWKLRVYTFLNRRREHFLKQPLGGPLGFLKLSI